MAPDGRGGDKWGWRCHLAPGNVPQVGQRLDFSLRGQQGSSDRCGRCHPLVPAPSQEGDISCRVSLSPRCPSGLGDKLPDRAASLAAPPGEPQHGKVKVELFFFFNLFISFLARSGREGRGGWKGVGRSLPLEQIPAALRADSHLADKEQCGFNSPSSSFRGDRPGQEEQRDGSCSSRALSVPTCWGSTRAAIVKSPFFCAERGF